ncbi:MAG: zinc-ribbon domain-containing protein [Candidatus Coproplasma sp.]
MRYCKGCGSELPDGAVFCPSCGRNVQNDAQSERQNNTYNNYNNNANGNRTFDSEYCQNDNYQRANGYSNPESYSPLTILGLVFSFVTSLVGLILSIIAYNEAKRVGSEKNISLSKTGIILSSVFLGLEVFAVILFFGLVFAGIVIYPTLF